MNLLDGLNDVQRSAVEFLKGPTLIFAGAGSGKTRVLTHKIAYIIEKQFVYPRNILAVTFTNKAARELKERVKKFIGHRAGQVNIGTFHSICARLLRMEIEHIGYDKNFSIYDAADQQALIKSIIRDNNIDLEGVKPNSIKGKISYLKNEMIEPKDFKARKFVPLDRLTEYIYPLYQAALKRVGAVDFDDLLLLPLILFKEHPKILRKYQQIFKYILVDEYQDTNIPQFQLVSMLSDLHKNICVVGDDDQSIYSWRGAKVENILKFDKTFPNCRVFKLEQNYRSTKNILAAASAIVKNNENRAEKTLWADKEKGELITQIEASDEWDESGRMASSILNEIRQNKRNFKDFAILYRTNAQSRILEQVLTRNRIPNVIIGGVRFYERKEIKDILAYFRLLANNRDNVAFQRIINTPTRGIGKVTLDKLIEYANLNDFSYYETLNYVDEMKMSARAKNALTGFRNLIKQFQDIRSTITFEEWANIVIDRLGMRKYFKEDGGEESDQRLANIDELLNSIADYCSKVEEPTLEGYLEEVALITDIDSWDDKKNAVSMMTFHSAKGLEFPVVFLCGMNKGLFPIQRDPEESNEEERRLFYVGLTRAMEKIFLSSAETRNFRGENLRYEISPFMKEIPFELLEKGKTKERVISPSRIRKSSQTFNSSPEPTTKLDKSVSDSVVDAMPGMMVSHKIFGAGKIINVAGFGKNAKLTIMFRDSGKKTIIAKYVKIKS